MKYSQVESCKSKAELEAQAETVDLEKKLVDLRIIEARERLEMLETVYLVVCQVTDALMVVHIIASQIVVDVAGVAMFDDMVRQNWKETQQLQTNADGCAENGGSMPCTSIQLMTCDMWKQCGASIIAEDYPTCGEFCRIADEVRLEHRLVACMLTLEAERTFFPITAHLRARVFAVHMGAAPGG